MSLRASFSRLAVFLFFACFAFATTSALALTWQKANMTGGTSPSSLSVPASLAVSFRREFLARTAWTLTWRMHSPLRQRHREGIVAITFNGTRYKPDALLALADGDLIEDAKGRFGYWTAAHIGPLRTAILDYCRAIVSAQRPTGTAEANDTASNQLSPARPPRRAPRTSAR